MNPVWRFPPFRRVCDSHLGRAIEFGGRRSDMAFCLFLMGAAAGFCLWDLSQSSPDHHVDGGYYVFWALLFAGAGLSLLWIPRKRLTIGERGFRLNSPLGSDEVLWGQVATVEYLGGRKWDSVRVICKRDAADPRPHEILLTRLFGFSAPNGRIARLITMRQRMATAQVRRVAIAGDAAAARPASTETGNSPTSGASRP